MVYFLSGLVYSMQFFSMNHTADEMEFPRNSGSLARMRDRARRNGILPRSSYDVPLANRFIASCESAYIVIYGSDPRLANGAWFFLSSSERDSLYVKWCNTVVNLLDDVAPSHGGLRLTVLHWVLKEKLFHAPEWMGIPEGSPFPFGGYTWSRDLSVILSQFRQLFWLVSFFQKILKPVLNHHVHRLHSLSRLPLLAGSTCPKMADAKLAIKLFPFAP